MKNYLYTSLFLLFAAILPAQTTPDLESYTLKNGLKIYLLKYGKIEAMHIKVMINSGKKNETPGQQGYNAIVSDMILKGNKKFAEEAQNDRAFALGAEFSSGSGFDYTSVSCNLKTKDAKAVLEMMSAAVMQPLFEKEKLDQFLSYIISYNSPTKMNISEMSNVYSALVLYGTENPLGRQYFNKQLKQITPEKLRAFHEFNYTPKNTRVVVCGNFDSGEIKKLIEENFGAWQSSYGEVNGVELELPKIKKKESFFVNRVGGTQCAIRWNKSGPSLSDKDMLSCRIANMLFNQVLFKEIREKGGKTYSIGSSLETSKFSNIIAISCSVRSEVLLSTLELFDKTIADFSLGNFSKEDFDTEITRYRVSLMSEEYPEEIADMYNPVIYDFNKRKNTLADLNNITMEDVKKVIKKYYTPDVYKLVIAGDENSVNTQLEKIKGLKKLKASDLEYKGEE